MIALSGELSERGEVFFSLFAEIRFRRSFGSAIRTVAPGSLSLAKRPDVPTSSY
jgi:hypothetical protein